MTLIAILMNFNLFFLVVIWDTNCFTKKSSNDFITSLSLLHSTPSRDDDASIALREYNNHFSEGSGYFLMIMMMHKTN